MSIAEHEEFKPVSIKVFDPSNSLFKQKANEKATCETISCKLESCPLRDAGSCMYAPAIGWARCPYGTLKRDIGPTRRARKFYQWVRDKKESARDVGSLSSPNDKMEFVGDYVYLPYAHMSLCEDVQFLSHGGPFRIATPLIPKQYWTLETVVTLVRFRPQALFGGEIFSYQKESLPLFLLHLREADADMWGKLIEVMPKLNKAPDHIGRRAILTTLNHPIEWKTKHAKYPVHWKWDGEHLITSSINAYNSTWGDLKIGELVLKASPDTDTEITVQDNSWVNEGTKFTT